MCWLILVVAPLAAQDDATTLTKEQQETKAANDLFDILRDELFSNLQPDGSKADEADNANQPDEPASNTKIRAGEDIGEASQHPLLDISRRMRLAQDRMRRNLTESETQRIQNGIVSDLDDLLMQMRLQVNNRNSNSNGAGRSNRASSQTPQDPQSAQGSKSASLPGQTGTNRPATDSSTRLGGVEATKSSPSVSRRALVEKAWGHLPAQTRDQMHSSGIERFLPKYESLIEDYYRRLADENGASP